MIVRPRQDLGCEAVPLWVVDEAHPAPDRLVEQALSASFQSEPGAFYPGARADAPVDYAAWLEAVTGRLAEFDAVRVLRATFAVATADPAGLAPVQRIPHYDGPDEDVYATVHYLCGEPHRGTGFFRHVRSGFERITAARTPAWRHALSEDRMSYGLPGDRYHAGSRQGFEQTGYADCVYNRLIIYPANCLHSGDIGLSWRAGDLRSARLTVTGLLTPGRAANVTGGHLPESE